MHVTGIITEYNPFHNGHRLHIEETRKLTACDVLVCVMSSNFVQRGEPAICDKWKRTKTAIENGCDLVIELPFPFATQSAAQFATGAITCLELANVQDVVFGSESNDIEMLKRLGSIDTTHYRDVMNKGLSPVKAYESIYGKLHPNDILGMNYVKAAANTNIITKTIKRTNHYHEEQLQATISSATAIRTAYYNHQDIDSFTCMTNSLTIDFQYDHYYPYIRTLLLTQSTVYLASLFMMDEGIEHNLIKNARKYAKFDDFLQHSISKRYTASRIRRTLIHLMNQTTKKQMNTLPKLQHIRVLGFNNIGKSYLKTLKDKTAIASRFNQIPLIYREMELRATSVYAYPLNEIDRNKMMERELGSPIYITCSF